MASKGSRKRNTNNDPISFNSIFDEGFVKGRGQGYKKGIKEGYAKGVKKGHDEGLKKGHDEGLKEGKIQGLKDKEVSDKGQSDESIHLKIMNEWNHLRLLMINRQQLNILLIGISPYHAFERKRDKSQANPEKIPFFSKEKTQQILSIYDAFDDIEKKMVKVRVNLRKLYNNEVFNATIRTILGSDRIIGDISHAMENSFIIPLPVIYEINQEYIEPYLQLLYSKYPPDKKRGFNGSLKTMLKDIDDENKEYNTIINAINNNDIHGLQTAIEAYIDNFAPIRDGSPVNVGAPNTRKTLANRKANAKAKANASKKSKSKSKSPLGTAIPSNGIVSL